jgi:hypothetical protein
MIMSRSSDRRPRIPFVSGVFALAACVIGLKIVSQYLPAS